MHRSFGRGGLCLGWNACCVGLGLDGTKTQQNLPEQTWNQQGAVKSCLATERRRMSGSNRRRGLFFVPIPQAYTSSLSHCHMYKHTYKHAYVSIPYKSDRDAALDPCQHLPGWTMDSVSWPNVDNPSDDRLPRLVSSKPFRRQSLSTILSLLPGPVFASLPVCQSYAACHPCQECTHWPNQHPLDLH